jgi:uncharacterized protein YndB with AHSA1/START domain
MQDRIEKQVALKAPVERVWRALTDYREFGSWFGARMEQAFVPGEQSAGQITYPGYEHLRMHITIQKMEPEKFFSFTWHPYAIDPKVDYSAETPTLVEFQLQATPEGTLLRVTESGLSRLPQHRYSDVLRMNERGWEGQMDNIARHVAQQP